MGTIKPEASSSDTGEIGMGLKDIFKLLEDENGRVTSARLKGFVKDLELDISDAEVKEMMNVVDPSGKGEITYKGLVGIVRDFNQEFPNVQLTPEEMKRELTVLVEEDSTVTENDEEQVKEVETRPESTKSEHVEQDDEEEKMSEASENSVKENEVQDEEEETEQQHEETEEEDEDNQEDETVVNDEKREEEEEEDESDNQAEPDTSDENDDVKSEIKSEGTISKPPTRMSFTREHRLDSAISTAVGKMVEGDNKSLRSTNSKRTMRSRSKSDSCIPTRRGSMKSSAKPACRVSTTERSNSRTRADTAGNQPTRKPSQTKSIFKPMREPEYYSTVGCSLKLSQIRVKQRLLYIMWRVVYDQAVKKMQEEKKREMAARQQKKKSVKKRMSVASK